MGQMIKYIIVDDEPLAREGMSLNCEQVPFLDPKGSFPNAIEAAEFLNKNPIDLMFLDIEMPGLSGLEFIRSLKNAPQIILCTAYPQYALESYELDVTDYLVKPIKFERFFKAVNKVRDYMNLNTGLPSTIDDYGDSYMFIKSDRQFVKIYYDDVLYIKGMKDYVVIHTTKGKFMTAMNVKTILGQLPKNLFARTSKSFVLQVKKITSISVDTIYMEELELPLGPSYKEAFIKDFVNTNLVSR